MSKKFSIIKTIDLNKLGNEIKEYIQYNGCFDPYIFMNEDTANAITQEIGANIVDTNLNDTNSIKSSYDGYRMFINNDLKFGIVEIR